MSHLPRLAAECRAGAGQALVRTHFPEEQTVHQATSSATSETRLAAAALSVLRSGCDRLNGAAVSVALLDARKRFRLSVSDRQKQTLLRKI